MPVNLLNLLENELSGDALSRVSSFIGEKPAATESAIINASKATLHALNEKAQTAEGARALFEAMQRGGFDGTAFRGTGSMVAATGAAELAKTGTPLAAWLFGPRLNGVIDWLAATAGVGKQSAGALLALAVPIALNLVAREASSAEGFFPASVANLLKRRSTFLGSLAPGLADVLGLTNVGAAVHPAVPEPAHAAAAPENAAIYAAGGEDTGRGYGWIKWVIPLLLLPLIVWTWRGTHTPEAGLDATPVPRSPEADATRAGTGALVKQPLICGQVLEVAENGIEARLVGFIENRALPVDDAAWFSFDRLEFETGSATLGPASEPQLRNIVEIMNCYTNVELKIGGYTDNVGDPVSNRELSAARAENTMEAIVASGIAPSRLTAEGYGERHPVASNDTEEGRQRNRRIDVRVTRK